MASLNRWQVLEKVEELAPVTRSSIDEAFAGDADKVEGAFDAAQRHGLIESQEGDNGSSTWVVTAKGQKKLAKRS